MPDQTWGVALIRRNANVINELFLYRGERLPELGDEIEVTIEELGQGVIETTQGVVTDVRPEAALPITATEVG